jgi:hypothetical protein
MERKLHGNTVKGKSKMKEAILFQNRGFPLKERISIKRKVDT